MPSGAYETSHGDSWITALVYFSFFEYLRGSDAKFKTLFDKEFGAKRVRLAVYGDDNVLGIPLSLTKWITKETITQFFFSFAGFVIRDYEEHSSFLSLPDGRGGLAHKGVCFLQKYAIPLPLKYRNKGLPPVVHYRPAMVNIRKFSKGSGEYRDDFDYFLSAITGAYDNPFNQVWYDFCVLAAKYFTPEGDWSLLLPDKLKRSQGYVSKLMKKAGIKITDLFAGVPNVEIICEMNKYHHEHHLNNVTSQWETVEDFDFI
jgi:hypothetical protein